MSKGTTLFISVVPYICYNPSIVQIYFGAVNVNTKHANKIAGAAHSNCPCLR